MCNKYLPLLVVINQVDIVQRTHGISSEYTLVQNRTFYEIGVTEIH